MGRGTIAGGDDPRLGPVPRAYLGIPGAGGGREPARPDRPAPRGPRGHGPPVLPLARPGGRGAAAPPVRHVARGPRPRPRGECEGGPAGPLADLLVRAEGSSGPGTPPGPRGVGPGQARRQVGRPALAELA